METEYFACAPVPKAMVKFIVPTILSQLVTLLYNLADAFFVGHTNDPNQLAALTLSFPIFMFLTVIGNLVGASENTYAYTASCLQWTVVAGDLPTVTARETMPAPGRSTAIPLSSLLCTPQSVCL